MGLTHAFKSVYYELEYDTTDAVLSCDSGIDCKNKLNNYLSFYSVPSVKQMLFFPVIRE